MKLLLINNEFPPIGGGGSTVTKYAIKHLGQAGHDITLLTSRYKNLPHREIIDGATIIRIPAVRRYADYAAAWELVIFGISAFFYTLFFTFRHRVDFIQAYFAVPAGWVAWLISYLRPIPYSVYFGGSDIPGANPSRYQAIYPYITPLLKAIWRRAKFRTVCSQDLVELVQQADPDSKFIHIPNGVDTVRFKPIERAPNPKVKILFIGRLIPRKGFQRVIRALPKVLKLTNQPFEIEVVGTGSAQTELNTLATALKVSHLISYVGTIPYDKLETTYQYADIFVLTSLSEGMPSVILEAMGCGLPIIASDVGGNNEIVKEGENGYLIKDDNSDLLAVTLARLIDNPSLRQQFGKVSRETSKKYDWRHIMMQYNELYSKHARK